jgi:hypothetical protein
VNEYVKNVTVVTQPWPEQSLAHRETELLKHHATEREFFSSSANIRVVTPSPLILFAAGLLVKGTPAYHRYTVVVKAARKLCLSASKVPKRFPLGSELLETAVTVPVFF